MKKLLILLLTMACSLCLAFSFAGCTGGDLSATTGGNNQTEQGGEQTETGGSNETGGEHVHNYVYKCSPTEHWQENSNGEEKNRAAHELSDGVCPVCGYVEKCTEGLDFTEIKENEETIGYIVSKGTATDSHLYIPSFYNGLPVLIVPGPVLVQAYGCPGGIFCGWENLESVTIGNNVTSIDTLAFEGCVNLESVTIPDSVTYIDVGAFEGTACYNNPDNWDNDVLYIDNCLIEVKETFSESYEIKQGTKFIAPRAFEKFLGFVNITIPDSVIFINSGTFWGYSSILQSITVAEGNTNYSSQDGVLYNKDKTELIQVPQAKTNVTIPDSVTTIGEQAFNYCTSLTEITIPDSVITIGENAFLNCTSLESVTIGNGVTSIGGGAFGQCTSLKSVTIGNGVTTIGWGAFQFCTSLTEITIPKCVTEIGERAFGLCERLESITVADGNTNYSSQDGVLYNKEKTELIQVPQTKTSVTIPNSITSIGREAFEGCKSLESVTIPDSVTEIGSGAFEGCTSLTEITIPNSVTSIGSSAFFRCTSLESVIFENPNGWYCAEDSSETSGENIPSEDLNNHATAAEYLTDTYSNCRWERKTA